jgi:hypothetical protein
MAGPNAKASLVEERAAKSQRAPGAIDRNVHGGGCPDAGAGLVQLIGGRDHHDECEREERRVTCGTRGTATKRAEREQSEHRVLRQMCGLADREVHELKPLF